MSNNNKISLEQSLKGISGYACPCKVFLEAALGTGETFSSPDMLSCTPEEQEQGLRSV